MRLSLKANFSICSFIICLMLSHVSVHAESVNVGKTDKLPPAQMGISPPQIIQKIDMGSGRAVLNKSVTLYNYNPSPKQVTLSLFDTDKNKQPIEPSKQTLTPWTILNPRTFTIPGNGQQTIRLSVRPPQNFPAQTNHAVLLISQIVNKPVKNQDGSVILSFGSSYGLPITITTQTAATSQDTHSTVDTQTQTQTQSLSTDKL